MLQDAANMLLQNAIGVIPIALVVAVLCKTVRMRPATRHMLWLGVLVFLVIPPTLPEFSRSLLESASPARDTTIANLSAPSTTDEAPPAIRQAALASTTEQSPALRQARTKNNRAQPSRQIIRNLRPTRARAIPTKRTQFRAFKDENRIAEAPAQSANPQPRPLSEWSAAPIEEPVVGAEEPRTTRESSAGPDRPVLLTVALTTWRSAQGIAGDMLTQGQMKASAAFASVRETVGAIPRMPAWLWFGGVVVVLVTALIRLVLACRLFRLARPAPDSVRALIESAAQELGLRRAPRTMMVEDRVSPMVWCGLRTTLVLPESLWADLDIAGRRAVVRHELAHIKRRDHWVRWAELLIGTLYWWHPIVWWARRRVHEEADLSCDLWVTALMPGVRAPYARALLMTKQYVSSGGGGVPSVGIGAVSPGAKRFSRRITMVMTTKMNPRTSIVGVALAASLVLGGVYSAPTWACDAPKPAKPVVAPTAPEAPNDLSTFEQYMIERAPEPAPEPAPCDQAAPVADEDCDSPCRSSRVASTLGNINGKIHSIVNDQLAYAYGSALYAVADDGAELTVTYRLPSDRLKGLTKLMSREDVPLLIEPLDDGIVVHGNAEQQRRFAAFVAILNPKKEKIGYVMLNEGKLDDLIRLMSLNSVPTLIHTSDHAISVEGNANTQRAFAEFVQMIDPGSGHGVANKAYSQADRGQSRHPLESEAAKVKLRVLGMFDEAERLREMEEVIMAQAEAIEAQADGIEEQSEQHREHAESILEKIEALLDRAEGLSSAEQYEAMVEAEAAQHEASRMMRLAEVIESQIGMVMSQAEALAHQAEAFGDQADALEDQAEELAESLEDQLEDLEDMLEDRLDEFNDWTHEHAEALHELLQEHADRLDEELSHHFGG